MSYVTGTFHTNLAYRLGETAAPSDSTTKAIRLAWANDGYLTIARRRYWWWQQASHSSNVNSGATSYSEPTDLKEFIKENVKAYEAQKAADTARQTALTTAESDITFS